MTYRYQIKSPATETALMKPEHIGGIVTFLFFDAGGMPVVPVGLPSVDSSAYVMGDSWRKVEAFSDGEWRFNRYAQRLRVNMAGVSGYSSYTVEVWRSDEPVPMVPDGAYTGMRAAIMQTYDESNKKLGAQWEASRLVTIASNSPTNNVYSILRTRDMPVDLKARTLGYTGTGVIGRIYKNPIYTGGTADPVFNMNPRYLGTQPEAQLLTGFTLTALGTKCGADVYGIGNTSNQGRGSTPHTYGSNRILDEPNTEYLLEIASTDTQSQQVYARIEFYEGNLDLPVTP